MCVEVWFDFFARLQRGSDDRGLASVVLCTFTPWVTHVVLSLAPVAIAWVWGHQ